MLNKLGRFITKVTLGVLNTQQRQGDPSADFWKFWNKYQIFSKRKLRYVFLIMIVGLLIFELQSEIFQRNNFFVDGFAEVADFSGLACIL